MAILITGGAGFIGSHTAVELLNLNKEMVIIDNFSNSTKEVIHQIKNITKKDFKFYEIDYLDRKALETVFNENNIDAVLNFAGYKAVGESVKDPLSYYQNNVSGILTLLDVMKQYDVKTLVFSSSATVYGNPKVNPITEDCKIQEPTNPYGKSKQMIEQILQDLYQADPSWNICVLRYFNPIGAHQSGLIGENPKGIPNNLMPAIAKVATGETKELLIFGNDYSTPDGTCIRDYIHIVDLAKGHIQALKKLEKEKEGYFLYNLGTGRGYSVFDVLQAFEKVTGKTIPYQISSKRPGDIPICYADPKKAKEELGWEAQLTLEDMCHDFWNYICTK